MTSMLGWTESSAPQNPSARSEVVVVVVHVEVLVGVLVVEFSSLVDMVTEMLVVLYKHLLREGTSKDYRRWTLFCFL